jgi:PAS domain S-box-containing protein
MSERRYWRRASGSPMPESRQSRVPSVLEQCPVPAVALAADGAVLFANSAFSEILGCSCDAVASMSYEDIISALPAEETLFAVARLRADTIGGFSYPDGSTFFAKMRKSAVMHGADPVAIVTFEELSQRLSRLAEP